MHSLGNTKAAIPWRFTVSPNSRLTGGFEYTLPGVSSTKVAFSGTAGVDGPSMPRCRYCDQSHPRQSGGDSGAVRLRGKISDGEFAGRLTIGGSGSDVTAKRQ